MADALISTARTVDGAVVVEIRGEVDLRCSDQLRQLLVDTATQLRPVRVVVDMRHVTFIDSTGLGALAAGRNAARTVGVPLMVRDPSPFVAGQLHRTGLHRELVIDD